MAPLNDEIKLQVDEKNNKKWKYYKFLTTNNILNFKTIRLLLKILNWLYWKSLFIQFSNSSLWELSASYDYKKRVKSQSKTAK